AQAASDLEVLLSLHVEGRARHFGEFLAQFCDDLVGAQFPLSQRLQGDEHAALIHRSGAAAKTNHGGDIRILHSDVNVPTHLAAHGVERDVLSRLYRPLNPPRILLRKKTPGNFSKQVNAEASSGNGN